MRFGGDQAAQTPQALASLGQHWRRSAHFKQIGDIWSEKSNAKIRVLQWRSSGKGAFCARWALLMRLRRCGA
eukprot:scaffold995_cov244-Pinguiococcus_pyrenoidosus.AAC.11